MKPTHSISNFITTTCKIIGYLILTVIVYTTLHNLYAEKETATMEAIKQHIEMQKVHNDMNTEEQVIELL